MSEIQFSQWSDPTYFNNNHALSMTIRDYFAASAMQAMMTSPELMVVVTADQVLGDNAKERISKLAYQYADAMLKAREK